MERKLLIYCSGGMGNRFNSIINGLYFNDKYFKGDVILYWPNELTCDCNFTDLFEIPSNMSAINTLDKLGDFNIFGNSRFDLFIPQFDNFGLILKCVIKGISSGLA